MKTDKYTLDIYGNAVPCYDLSHWAKWFESSLQTRVVERTEVADHVVSTVFLSLDHRFGDAGDPVLWETMVFDGKGDGQEMMRYSSRQDALVGHRDIVTILRNRLCNSPLNFDSKTDDPAEIIPFDRHLKW